MIRKSTKYVFEESVIGHFMLSITHQKPVRMCKLDLDKKRNRPDFSIYYNNGVRYTLEIERWQSPDVRRLENKANRDVTRNISKKLKGTFIWSLPFDSLTEGFLPSSLALKICSEILTYAPNLSVSHSHPLSLGNLMKVYNSGNRLVVQITAKEVINIATYPHLMNSLKNKLGQILTKAEKKFYRYRGVRVLLLIVKQSRLDVDYHANSSKYSIGIIRKWLENSLTQSTRLDYIYIGQGMRVWDSALNRILTGHKYVDQPHPHYVEAWRKPNLPPFN